MANQFQNSKLDRRSLLKLAGSSLIYILGSEIMFGSEVGAEQRQTFQNSMARSMFEKLAEELPPLDGAFVFDQVVRENIAVDFGRFIKQVPWGVLIPGSHLDVKKIVLFANRNSIPVTLRGTGGSAYGQSQVANGIIIDSNSLKKMEWISDSSVKLEAGVLWVDALDFTMHVQKTPPVLPDTMFISIGGTLNAAGIGETSYRCGAQIDNVLELEVVTGTGEYVVCSPTVNSEIFNMVLGGMGQCGLILSATILVVPAPDVVFTKEYKYPGSDSETYLNDMKQFALNEPNGAIGGHLVRDPNGISFTYVLEATYWENDNPPSLTYLTGESTSPVTKWSFYDYANRNTAGWIAAVKSGAAALPHPYFAFFISGEEIQNVIQYILQTPSANLGATRVALFPEITVNFKQPLQSMPQSEVCFHIRIYRIVRDGSGSPDHLAMLSSNQNEMLPLVLISGGTMYLPFCPNMNLQQKLLHFGSDVYSQFALAKKFFDPQKLLTSGAELF